MLFYPVLRPLRCVAYVPAIATAHVLIYDHILLLGRHNIFTDFWKHLPCRICNAHVNIKETTKPNQIRLNNLDVEQYIYSSEFE